MTPSIAATMAALLLAAMVLSMVEAAVTGVSPRRMQEEARRTGRPSARELRVVEDPTRYVNTALLLRKAAQVALVALALLTSLERWGIGWALVGVCAALVVIDFMLVGVAARTLGQQHALGIVRRSARPLILTARLLGPLPPLLILVGNAITPGRGFRQGPFGTESELRALVDEAEASHVIESDERRMIHSVFDLGDTVVREVMVPRTNMVTVASDKTLRKAMSLALRSGFSRIPVIGENLDDVIGVVYLKDISRRLYDNREAETAETVARVMREPVFVPDSKPAGDLLKEMQAERHHVAIVVDEYGGTAGLVTIEDILEEIVGEITDEYDTETVAVKELDAGVYRVSSRLNIEELGELFGIELRDDDVDSVGGLMAKTLGEVPITGTSVEVAGLLLVAESASGRRNRIDTVVVRRAEDDEDAEPEDTAGRRRGGSGA